VHGDPIRPTLKAPGFLKPKYDKLLSIGGKFNLSRYSETPQRFTSPVQKILDTLDVPDGAW